MKKRISSLVLAGICLAALLGLLMPTPSQALSLVISRADLGGNDFVDWSGSGTDTVVASGSTILSNMGLTVAVTNPVNDFQTREQGSSWAGNFAPGDVVLWTALTPGPLQISFDSPVFGAGAQIQRAVYGEFEAFIEVYDSSHTSLGVFSLGGNSTADADNSAIFLGVFDPLGRISMMEYAMGDSLDFGINRLDLQTAAVPLPSAALLLGSGLLSLAGLRRFAARRRR